MTSIALILNQHVYAQTFGYRGDGLVIAPSISARCSSIRKKYKEALRVVVSRS